MQATFKSNSDTFLHNRTVSPRGEGSRRNLTSKTSESSGLGNDRKTTWSSRSDGKPETGIVHSNSGGGASSGPGPDYKWNRSVSSGVMNVGQDNNLSSDVLSDSGSPNVRSHRKNSHAPPRVDIAQIGNGNIVSSDSVKKRDPKRGSSRRQVMNAQESPKDKEERKMKNREKSRDRDKKGK